MERVSRHPALDVRARHGCDAVGVDCTAIGLHVGIAGQFHFIPDGKVNPWVGYGIGAEISRLSGTRGGDDFSVVFSGLELAHLMAGADFRLTRVFGIGPYADFALGQYSNAKIKATKAGMTTERDGEIADKTLHEWLTLGVKVTFFP